MSAPLQHTPGPWFWWGNTDYHSVALCGRQPGLGVTAVLSTLAVERDPDGRDAREMRESLADVTNMTPEEIEDAVHEWAFDEWGSRRTDERLAITDENFHRRTVDEVAVYQVARAQGLPDDTPRDHELVYRADVCDLRTPNARYLTAVSPEVVAALVDEVRRLRAAIDRVRALHYPADNDHRLKP